MMLEIQIRAWDRHEHANGVPRGNLDVQVLWMDIRKSHLHPEKKLNSHTTRLLSTGSLFGD